MVSMTLFMPERDFSAFYVHVSRLAWHTQDMLQDARVALSIAETDDGRADPFTLMRVTVRGDAVQLKDGPKDAWLEALPRAGDQFRARRLLLLEDHAARRALRRRLRPHPQPVRTRNWRRSL